MKIFLRTNGMKPVGIFFCLLLFISFISPPTAEGTVFFVTESGAGAIDGTSWADAFDEAGFIEKFKDAAVVSGDQFWVAAGSYRPTTVSGEVGAYFEMKQGISLYGGFAGTEATPEQRDIMTNLTILTGDLQKDDSNGELSSYLVYGH